MRPYRMERGTVAKAAQSLVGVKGRSVASNHFCGGRCFAANFNSLALERRRPCDFIAFFAFRFTCATLDAMVQTSIADRVSRVKSLSELSLRMRGPLLQLRCFGGRRVVQQRHVQERGQL